MAHRLAAVTVLLAIACARGPIVRSEVVRGGSPASLSIRIFTSDSTLAPAPVDIVQVNGRGGRAGGGTVGEIFWAIAHKPGVPALQLPAVLHYGTTPEGYGSTGNAPVLPMGEYEVRVNAGGVWSVTPFRVSQQNLIE